MFIMLYSYHHYPIPEVESLVHKVIPSVTFWGTAKLFTTVAIASYILNNNVQWFQFLFILSDMLFYF